MRSTIFLLTLLGALVSALASSVNGQPMRKPVGPVGPWSVREKDPSQNKGNWMLQYVNERKANLTRLLVKDEAGFEFEDGGLKVHPSSKLHPFQVALLDASIGRDYNATFCGGTLFKGGYVITAAHCSDFIYNTSQVAALVGTKTLSTTVKGNRVPVTSIAIHPKWNASTFDYDVAVWKLAANITKAPSLAKLAKRDSDPAPGVNATVSGWGYTRDSPTGKPAYSRDLHASIVPVIARTACNETYKGLITPRMLCASQTSSDRCGSDWGGPLTVKSTGPWDTLTGIVSWGNGCADVNYPSVYTRVGDPEIYDFITANANANDTRVLNGWVQLYVSAPITPQWSMQLASPVCPSDKQVKACSAMASTAAVVGTAYPAIDYKTETFATSCTCTFRSVSPDATGTETVQCAAYCDA